VIFFAKIRSDMHLMRSDQVAYVQDYNNIDIDKRKRIASFGQEGRHSWIAVTWICSLFGILRDGGVNLIATDIDIYK